MSVVGVAMSDYVEPDATDQRCQIKMICHVRDAYMMSMDAAIMMSH